MNLAISSIAWSADEESAVSREMNALGVAKVELAPTKIWDNPLTATQSEAQEVVEWWGSRGIEVYAFQSMLFSRPDLKLFEGEDNRAECLEYLKGFIELAGMMGVKRMVFGSPKNRQRNDMSYDDAFTIAVSFFKELSAVAQDNDVIFCIEPNAPQYGCDFVTTAKEGAELVRAVDHPGFGLHLDTACMSLAGDDVYASIKSYSSLLRHFHISSPMLEQVEERDDVDHAAAARALSEVGYSDVVSIEMRPLESGNVSRARAAISFAKNTYPL